MKVTVTDSAKKSLLQQIGEDNTKAIRISFLGYGWGGPRLGLALDEPSANDVEVQNGQFSFILEKKLTGSFQEVTIDYKDSWFQKGFTITTNSAMRC